MVSGTKTLLSSECTPPAFVPFIKPSFHPFSLPFLATHSSFFVFLLLLSSLQDQDYAIISVLLALSNYTEPLPASQCTLPPPNLLIKTPKAEQRPPSPRGVPQCILDWERELEEAESSTDEEEEEASEEEEEEKEKKQREESKEKRKSDAKLGKTESDEQQKEALSKHQDWLMKTLIEGTVLCGVQFERPPLSWGLLTL